MSCLIGCSVSVCDFWSEFPSAKSAGLSKLIFPSLQCDLYLLGINELAVGPTFLSCLSGLKFSLNMLWALSY